MSARLLRGRRMEAQRKHVISLRLTDDELEAVNRLVKVSGLAGSSIIRYGAMHYIHRELRMLAEDAA